MGKYGYKGDNKFKPITAWGYVGYGILFCIPVIGWIYWIVCAFSGKNINRRSYARSFFCSFLVALLIAVAAAVAGHFNLGGFKAILEQLDIPYLNTVVEQIDKWLPENSTPDTPAGGSETAGTERSAGNTGNAAAQTAAGTEPVAANTRKENTATQNTGSAAGVRKEVKDAIDGYEEFFREYADFMKNYTKSSNPLAMLGDYTKMIAKYAGTMEKWEKFDEDYSLNDLELKYYTDATLRIQKMLLDVV